MEKNRDYFLNTYTETEEMQYSKRKIHISRTAAGIMIAGLFLMCGIQMCHAEDGFRLKEQNEWDGAGDTWTCKKCGTKNYDWQISCSGCRGWK